MTLNRRVSLCVRCTCACDHINETYLTLGPGRKSIVYSFLSVPSETNVRFLSTSFRRKPTDAHNKPLQHTQELTAACVCLSVWCCSAPETSSSRAQQQLAAEF
jgi:hypothetical protein